MISKKWPASTNSSFDVDLVDQLIIDIERSYYPVCNEIQKDVCGFRRYSGKLSAFKVNPTLNSQYNLPVGTYTAVVEDDMINYFSKKCFLQTIVRHSTLEVTDINRDPIMYEKKIWLFVDGYLLHQAEVIIKPYAAILIIYPSASICIDKAILDEMIAQDLEWTLFMSPCSKFGYMQQSSWTLFGNTLIPYDNFKMYDTLLKVNKNSWNIFTNVKADQPNVFTTINAVMEEMEEGDVLKYFLRVTDEAAAAIRGRVGVSQLYLYNNRNIQSYAILNEDERWFRTEEDLNCPIHPLNFIVWKYDATNTFKEYLQDYEITQFFPNIYRLDTPHTGKIYIEWYYVETNEYKYLNFFDKYINGYLGKDNYYEMVKNNTLPPAIRDYILPGNSSTIEGFIPSSGLPQWDYSMEDFKDNCLHNDPYQYRADKINEVIKFFPEYLEDYYEDIYDKLYGDITNSYIIDLKDHPKVFDRNEFDNKENIDNLFSQEEYDEPYTYLVATNGSDRYRIVRVWVDGLRTLEFKHYSENGLDYIYIPKRLLKEDSVIELEFIDDYEAELTHIEDYTYGELYTVNSPTGYFKPRDIALFDTDSKAIINRDYLIITDQNGYRCNIDSTSNLSCDEYFVTFTQRLEHSNIDLYLSMEYLINANPKTHRTMGLVLGSMTQKVSMQRLEIYVDGRFVLPTEDAILITEPGFLHDNYLAYGYLNNPESRDITTIFEYMPYERALVYQADIIPSNGIIDLSSVLDKPLDLNYYDVYLNGKKINYTQLLEITEGRFDLSGVNSTVNLIIMEKVIDDEMIKADGPFISIDEELSAFDPDYKDWLDKDSGAIDNPDIVDDDDWNVIDDVNIALEIDKDILNELLKITFIDPNIRQIKGEAYELAKPRFITGTRRYRVNPDELIRLNGEQRPDLFHYNPDETVGGELNR